MSVFRNMQTTIKETKSLEKALINLNYKPCNTGIEQEVRGHGKEKFKADIVLKKEDTKLKGDIGFKKGKDSTYSLVYDTYVISMKQAEFLNTVADEYAKVEVKRKMLLIPGYQLVSDTTINGETKMRYIQVQ